ncbi:DsbA oxidoreductase family protein [Desulfovibrio sp. X2]|uniref:DsbA family protein n=1 Tax=Desulfovibrio sp. X2 TaxID=941449 RepID=UPI000358B568|nr:DsbA family protein [Desulfovibrio sp. X2]EPR42452.1 DsbA oxidoreductase family protein [Desulfovibrio sp. X2]
MRTIVLLLASLLTITACAGADKRDDKALREEMRTILHEHPDILLDVLRENKIAVYEIVEQGVAAKQAAEEQKRLDSEIKNPLQPTYDPSRPVLGNPSAPYLMVGYSDFLCPYCARAAKTISELVKKHPEVRFQFKHFPRTSLSMTLAKTFEAIGMQDPAKAWEFHDQVFARQEELEHAPQKTLDDILAGLHLDMARLAKDVKDQKIADEIEADAAEAQKFGFRGTPSFVLGGVSIRGAWPLEKYEEVLKTVEASHAAGSGAN